MASPRIFISSTFFDLRQVREDLERVIRELGYEPVRNETGTIPYGKDGPPEDSSYREIELCDIIVCIIGGRYGTESQQNIGYSITQTELRTALERGIQVFIFIEKGVHAEYNTYLINKENKEVKYSFVDNVKVYEFIESLYKLPKNNPIATFETSADITKYLKNQWAGLFQRFLQEQKRVSELNVLEEMKSVAGTLAQLVDFLTEERSNSDEAIKNILLANHPAFRRFAEITKTPYRVFFTNTKELDQWLNARGWVGLDQNHYDADSYKEWENNNKKSFNGYMKLIENIFSENGRLKIYTEENWNDDWLTFRSYEIKEEEEEDEIPF